MDELDDFEVRERLRQLRRANARQRMRDLHTRPLAEGETPAPIPNDAFGRGPSSPFYRPDFIPPWAPDWTPGQGALPPPLDDDDDGIEWRFA